MGPVEEVVVVPERETVSRVITVPAKVNAAIASLTTAVDEGTGKSSPSLNEVHHEKHRSTLSVRVNNGSEK